MIKIANITNEDYTEQDWESFRSWLHGVLKVTENVSVTFTKQDGTERVMNCTLHEDLLPKVEVKENTTPRKKSDTSLAVFDLDNQGWRSFTIRNIKRVDFQISDDLEEITEYTGEPC